MQQVSHRPKQATLSWVAPCRLLAHFLTKVRPRPKLLHACTPLFRRLFVADVSSVLELACLYVGVLGLGQPLGGIVACGRAEAKTGWGRSWTSSTFSRRRATVGDPQMYFLFMWPCPATGQSLVPGGQSKPGAGDVAN